MMWGKNRKLPNSPTSQSTSLLTISSPKTSSLGTRKYTALQIFERPASCYVVLIHRKNWWVN